MLRLAEIGLDHSTSFPLSGGNCYVSPAQKTVLTRHESSYLALIARDPLLMAQAIPGQTQTVMVSVYFIAGGYHTIFLFHRRSKLACLNLHVLYISYFIPAHCHFLYERYNAPLFLCIERLRGGTSPWKAQDLLPGLCIEQSKRNGYDQYLLSLSLRVLYLGRQLLRTRDL